MASTTPDRPSTTPNGCPQIDESVFTTLGGVEAPVTVAEFQRWFACFATAGEQE